MNGEKDPVAQNISENIELNVPEKDKFSEVNVLESKKNDQEGTQLSKPESEKKDQSSEHDKGTKNTNSNPEIQQERGENESDSGRKKSKSVGTSENNPELSPAEKKTRQVAGTPTRESGSGVAIKGYLMKKTSYNVWNRRWFELHDHLLMFYKGPESKKLLGCLDIWDACDISLLVDDSDSPNSANYKAFSIQVGDKFYIFRVDSREETKQWVQELRMAKNKNPKQDKVGRRHSSPKNRLTEAQLVQLKKKPSIHEAVNQSSPKTNSSRDKDSSIKDELHEISLTGSFLGLDQNILNSTRINQSLQQKNALNARAPENISSRSERPLHRSRKSRCSACGKQCNCTIC